MFLFVQLSKFCIVENMILFLTPLMDSRKKLVLANKIVIRRFKSKKFHVIFKIIIKKRQQKMEFLCKTSF